MNEAVSQPLAGNHDEFAHKQTLVVFFPIFSGISGVALKRKRTIKVIKTRYVCKKRMFYDEYYLCFPSEIT